MFRLLAVGLACLAYLPQKSLAPYVATPEEVVERMLALAEVTKKDVLYDLGCGDGRIPIMAAKKYGARGVGIDIDPRRIKESRENAKTAGVEHLVEFRLEDALQAGEAWTDRIHGVRANASTKSHAELDESETLDAGDPADLGRRYVALRNAFPKMRILGGCCGTDHRHAAAICEACAPPSALSA